MPCNELSRQIDDFLDGDLHHADARALTNHLEECAECRAVHTAELGLRAALRQLPVDGPSANYFERALGFARRRRRRNDPRRSSGFSAYALAAVATVVLAVGAAMLTDRLTPSMSVPEVTIALESTSTVNLVFSTATALANARISLEMPDGVEVVGFPGQRSLEWTTDLRPGKNALRVPVIAYAAVSDELVARLRHDTGTREFRVRLRVT